MISAVALSQRQIPHATLINSELQSLPRADSADPAVGLSALAFGGITTFSLLPVLDLDMPCYHLAVYSIFFGDCVAASVSGSLIGRFAGS